MPLTDEEKLISQKQAQQAQALGVKGIPTALLNPTFSTISSTSLAPTPQIQSAAAKPPSNFGATAQAYTDAILAMQNQPIQEEAKAKDITEEIRGLMEGLSTESTRQQELREQAGTAGITKDIQSGINRLRALQAERLALPSVIQEEFAGRGATKGGVAPIEAGRQRQLAIEELRTGAYVQALSGNLQVAESIIQDTLRAEFEPRKNELEILKQEYLMNKDALERIDKKRADRLNLLIGERDRLLKAEEMEKQTMYNIGLEAARSGATDADVQEIFNSSDKNEALAKASGFLSAEFRSNLEQRDFQNKIALRNLEINEAQLRLARDKQAIETAQKSYDVENGILDEKELRDVDTSPQGKKVKSLGDLKLKLIAYQALVDEFGTASFGEQKSKLDASYNDLKIAYKTAAELGAIQAPDVPIIEGAIRDATFSNPISQIFAKVGGGGRVATIQAGLETANELLQASGKTNLEQLLARNPKYGNSGYVQSLALPFMSTNDSVKIGGQDVKVGTIIVNSQGQKGRVNQDGSITPL